MHYYFLLILLVPLGLRAQADESPLVSQKSFGLHFSTGFSEPGESIGAIAFEAEFRKRRGCSWVWTAGREWEDTDESWGELPVTIPTVGQDSPSRTELRRFDNVRQMYRRGYLGGGPQLNYRIGPGDLGGSALLTLGYGQLTQRLTYRAFSYQGYENTNEFPLWQSVQVARIEYFDLIQPGARFQLHYTVWINQNLAVRGGGYLLGYGGIALPKYDKSGENPRFKVDSKNREIGHNRPGPFGDGLPHKSFFQSPSPHEVFLRSGLTIGIVYKPQ
ncbi:hypothetical protein [Lewinella sp. IMCC34191]|uniref:hypothetical protein n=1 Tax=Lewinella sp. IMCC34191 TaxID=2259172 RepID=UPI000E238EF1|nr:hypothetical protein [Lewinella sp. IMCC34191]